MLWTLAALANPPVNTSFVSYPPGGSGDEVCSLHIVTDGKEEPNAVLVSGCDPKFANMVRRALKTWRWEPGDKPRVEAWKVSFYQSSPYAKSRQLAEMEEEVDALVDAAHYSTVTPVKRVLHKYPPGGDGKEATCKTEMWFEAATGDVVGVNIDGCEEVFHDVTFTAAYQWKFEPTETEARWIRTTYPLKYAEPAEVPPLEDWTGVLEMVERSPVIVPARTARYRPAVCQLVVTVDASGKASKAESFSGCDESLHIAAENALRRSTFRYRGDPEPVRIIVPIEFPKGGRR